MSALLALLALLVPAVIASCTGSSPKGEADPATVAAPAATTTAPLQEQDRATCAADSRCTLAQAAASHHIVVGVGQTLAALRPSARRVVARQFTGVSLETELLWSVVQPQPGQFNFAPADAAVAWANRHGKAVTMTHFVWDQVSTDGNPGWLTATKTPAELRRVLSTQMRTLGQRYRGRIARWSVVNEPLQYAGSHLQDNVYLRLLGPDYIAEAFHMAHRLLPTGELWMNEVFTEANPSKADALVKLAASLVHRRIPIDGVSLQGHMFVLSQHPDFALVQRTLRRLASLGLHVGLSEIDDPHQPNEPGWAQSQARRVGAMASACVAVPACRYVSFWNLDDGHSWLDSLLHGQYGTHPTLYTADLRPKPAWRAVRDAFSAAP